MKKKYTNASSIEAVKETPLTCFYDMETNILHLNCPSRGYMYFRSWRQKEDEKFMRGETQTERHKEN